MSPSREPFGSTLEGICREREISLREVTRLAEKAGEGISITVLSHYMRGTDPNAMGKRGLEAVARALKLEPETFAEYRMALARESLDPAVVGFEKALATLDHLEAVRR